MDIQNVNTINGGAAVSGTDTLPYRVYRNVYQKAQAVKENALAKEFETERLEYGLGILEVLLGARFLFDLFNASALNLIDKLVQAVTFPFIAPFWAVFGKDPSYALSKTELMTLAAMIVYPIVVWAMLWAIRNERKKIQLA